MSAPRIPVVPRRGRTRLLYVTNNPAFFVSYRLHTALAARAAGFEVHVATPAGTGVEEILARGCIHHAFPLRRRALNPFRSLRTVLALRALYAAVRPDLVEQMTIQAVIFGSLAAYGTHPGPLINWMAGLGFLFAEHRGPRLLLRPAILAAYRMALASEGHHAVFENRDHRDYFVHQGLVDASRASVIEGAGVEMSAFAATTPPPGTPVVLFAGRMIWDKGVREFVSAAQLLRARGVHARFVLRGEPDPGNPASVDHAQLISWRENGVVEWEGASTDMPAEYRQCSIFCFPTAYAEGVPRVLIEAAASARPIVTTDMPGCREVVVRGTTGLLVPPRDAAAVADAIEHLLANPALCAAMGERGRQHVECRFSVPTVVGRTLGLYATLTRCDLS